MPNVTDEWLGTAEELDGNRLMAAHAALLIPPVVPSYGPAGFRGLELGGGPVPRRLSYIQRDAIDWSDRVFHSNGEPVQYDVGDARKLPYKDGAFDHVFSSNLLEHFPATETAAVLTEWTRVLRQHGALEIVVPDAMGILRDFFEGKDSWPNIAERLVGSQDYEGNAHRRAFTRSEFPAVIAEVPNLELVVLQPSHSGGGVHAIAIKED